MFEMKKSGEEERGIMINFAPIFGENQQ